MTTTPSLPGSCAKATTAAELRFRIEAPLAPSRAPRVVALDRAAAEVTGRVAQQPWATARFFTVDGTSAVDDGTGTLGDGLRLGALDGGPASLLGEELREADVVVMVASTDAGAGAASAIGMACSLRGILTAGLVLTEGVQVAGALSALRPHARVLMVPADEDDLFQLLTALRA